MLHSAAFAVVLTNSNRSVAISSGKIKTSGIRISNVKTWVSPWADNQGPLCAIQRNPETVVWETRDK